MNSLETEDLPNNAAVSFAAGRGGSVVISLCALAATFVVSNLSYSFQAKAIVFSAIIVVYLVSVFVIYKRRQSELRRREKEIFEAVASELIENRLLALEEAGTFFGASLKFPDMFRLISSRINELIPFTVCAFFLADESRETLKIVCAVGDNTRNLLNFEICSDECLAGKTFLSHQIQHEEKLSSDKKLLPEESLQNLKTGLAVPLSSGGEVFGVVTLYGDSEINFTENSVELIEAIGTRIEPLFLSSMAFERSLNNALTDALTSLPNERAFYLVLENQIAESQRNREERPLTILTVDIKHFTELNQDFGHAAGDRILSFAANLIKAQLRQMDFLARSQNDEFLAVLPTASNKTADEIVERIKKAFIFNEFRVSPKVKVNLQLNFGTATFGKNGETAQQLLQFAGLHKQQTKSGQKSKVILFPKEYVNQERKS